MRLTAEESSHGPLEVLGFPIKLTDDPCRVHRVPPDLGVDTDAILFELGYSAEEIATLHAQRVV